MHAGSVFTPAKAGFEDGLDWEDLDTRETLAFEHAIASDVRSKQVPGRTAK